MTAPMRIHIAFAVGGDSRELELELPVGATVADAISAANLNRDFSQVLAETVAFGVWGKVRSGEHHLRDGDRVELYISLQADPKVARRRKATQAGKMP